MTVWETVLARLVSLAERHDDLHRKVDAILARDAPAPGAPEEPGQQDKPGDEGQDAP